MTRIHLIIIINNKIRCSLPVGYGGGGGAVAEEAVEAMTAWGGQREQE